MKKTCISAVLTAIAAVVFCLPASSMAATYSLEAFGIGTLSDWLGANAQAYEEPLSGNYQAFGIGYEASFTNQFSVGDLIYTTATGNNAPSDWSAAFSWSDVVYSSENSAVETPSLLVYQLLYDTTVGNTFLDAGTLIVGFNDPAGDSDYDDLIIALKAVGNPIVPIPGTALMLGIGMLALSGVRRKN